LIIKLSYPVFFPIPFFPSSFPSSLPLIFIFPSLPPKEVFHPEEISFLFLLLVLTVLYACRIVETLEFSLLHSGVGFFVSWASF
jgi:hypothetical protein